jgi:hypothetical protein
MVNESKCMVTAFSLDRLSEQKIMLDESKARQPHF